MVLTHDGVAHTTVDHFLRSYELLRRVIIVGASTVVVSRWPMLLWLFGSQAAPRRGRGL